MNISRPILMNQFKHTKHLRLVTSYASRTMLLAGLTIFSSLPAQAEEKPELLQAAKNLQQLAADMRKTGKPLLLSFDAEYCPYCERLKAEHLQPMLNSGEYVERIIIRSLEFDGEHEITDFSGQRVTASDLSDKYKVRITPTLLFLNDEGEEVAERMLGYNTPDFYGAYLDKAIDKAVKTVTQ